LFKARTLSLIESELLWFFSTKLQKITKHILLNIHLKLRITRSRIFENQMIQYLQQLSWNVYT